MNGVLTLYLDQWGGHHFATSVRDLQRKLGGGRISKMYVDNKKKGTIHIGYVVGRYWCTAFQRVERKP